MLDYSLCHQTVTVYRMDKGLLQRQVIDGCHYVWEDQLSQELPGQRMDRKFLLIVPGNVQRVFPGDRVCAGIGPETVDWKSFLPVNVPSLGQVQYARACWWGGDICHVEAGRK